MSPTATATTLDGRGKSITTYIIYQAHMAFRDLAIGDRLEILTDAEPAIESDISAWCRMAGHRLIDIEPEGSVRRFLLEKGKYDGPTRKTAMIISDDGLLELLSPLGFALASALEGMDVNLYFQGPAVRVLTQSYKPRLHGMGRPFSRFPRTGLDKAGHVSPHQKIRQLQELGACIYACGPSMEHYKVDEDDFAFDEIAVCEYFTFMEVMSGADVSLFPS